jgi:hypothetical protein
MWHAEQEKKPNIVVNDTNKAKNVVDITVKEAE